MKIDYSYIVPKNAEYIIPRNTRPNPHCTYSIVPNYKNRSLLVAMRDLQKKDKEFNGQRLEKSDDDGIVFVGDCAQTCNSLPTW